jgi:hypothetical protein
MPPKTRVEISVAGFFSLNAIENLTAKKHSSKYFPCLYKIVTKLRSF